MEFESLYTNTVIVTPYRGAGRPQGAFVMERTIDAIASYLGKDRTEVRAANFIQPDEFPYDHELTFQDGRPLVYDSGDFPATLAEAQGPGRLGRVRGLPASRRAPRDAWSASGWPATSRAPGSGPTRARHVQVETSGRVKVATGLTTQGQGHQTVFAQIVADELGVRFEDVEVTTGDTRRIRLRASARSRPARR